MFFTVIVVAWPLAPVTVTLASAGCGCERGHDEQQGQRGSNRLWRVIIADRTVDLALI
jgi:hypothetical protein